MAGDGRDSRDIICEMTQGGGGEFGAVAPMPAQDCFPFCNPAVPNFCASHRV